MSEKKIEVRFSRSELIKSKFIDTLSMVEGYLLESRGDMSTLTSYSPSGVHKRIQDIKNSLSRDLEKLSNEIDIL
jgi:hypothetical protein